MLRDALPYPSRPAPPRTWNMFPDSVNLQLGISTDHPGNGSLCAQSAPVLPHSTTDCFPFLRLKKHISVSFLHSLPLPQLSCPFFRWTLSHCTAQADLEPAIFLPQPPKYWLMFFKPEANYMKWNFSSGDFEKLQISTLTHKHTEPGTVCSQTVPQLFLLPSWVWVTNTRTPL